MTLDDNVARNAGGLLDEWRNAAYNCFSSGHKFCRGVCPAPQATHDETHSLTAFHANVVAIYLGLLAIEDVAEDYVHCTQRGACELRCPNTIFAGDFYRFLHPHGRPGQGHARARGRQRHHQPGWQRWNLAHGRAEQRARALSGVSQERVADWPPSSTCRSAARRSSSATARRRSLHVAAARRGEAAAGGRRRVRPHARAVVLRRAGRRDGPPSRRDASRSTTWPTGGVGAKRILVLDPHDYITFTEDYPRYFGEDYDFEIVLVVELVAELIRDGRLRRRGRRRRATYHDACRRQAQGHPSGAARDHARDPGADVRGRRSRHAVGRLLRGRRRPRHRAPRGSRPPSRARRVAQAEAARRRPAGVGLRVVGRHAVGAQGADQALEVCHLMEPGGVGHEAPSGRTPPGPGRRPAPTAVAPTTHRPTPAGRRRAASPCHAPRRDGGRDLGALDAEAGAGPGAVAPLRDVVDVLERQPRDRAHDLARLAVDALALVEPARVVVGRTPFDGHGQAEPAVADQLGHQLQRPARSRSRSPRRSSAGSPR